MSKPEKNILQKPEALIRYLNHGGSCSGLQNPH